MSYSTYNTDVIPMDFGLDLSTPKPVAPSGTLSSCLNYEITDRVGLRRIDGFERFDGRIGGECTTFWEIGFGTGTYAQGDYVAVDLVDDDVTAIKILGKVVEVVSAGVIRVAVLDDQLLPVLRDDTGLATQLAGTLRPLYVVDPATLVATPQGAPTFCRDLRYAVGSPAIQRSKIVEYQAYLRSAVTALPGTPLLSTSYARRHYAAAGVKTFTAITMSSFTPVLTGIVGSVLGNSMTGATVRVLKAEVGPGSIIIHYDDVTGDITQSTFPPLDTYVTGLVGTLNGVPINDTTFSVDPFSFNTSTDESVLYYCAGEQLEFDELDRLGGGWRRVDMGYTIPFTSGSAASGFLAKFERGLDIPTTGFQYWLSNGTTTFTCELNSYYVTSGSLTAGDAVGFLQISKLVRTAGTGSAPDSGYTLYNSATFSPATDVASISGPMVYNFLPGLGDLTLNSSRFQLQDRNFYATDGLGMVYGVSGASRAFYFNHERLAFIYTAPTETVFPRHIGFISSSLALGYGDGRVAISVPGEPWNYSGVDGAYEYGAGYPVRGLLQMQGDTIGVFTSGGVFAIQGSTQDNYVGRTLVPDIGAVEYTVVSVGDAVFVSPSGVVALSQSDKYGDFVGQPISFRVNPLIRPRAGRPGRIVAAAPVRNKNQYRLYCSDGTIFSMTFREGKPVETTTQTYYVGRANADDFRGKQAVPLALSSVLGEDGVESILFSHYSPTSRSSSSYVYKSEAGWGFDGSSIPSDCDLNWYFAQQPFANKVLRKIRLDGVGFGQTTLDVRTAKDYELTFSRAVRADMPESPAYITGLELPYTRMVNVEERGLNIAVKVEHLPEFSSPEPSHTLQTLFIQFTGAKTDA